MKTKKIVIGVLVVVLAALATRLFVEDALKPTVLFQSERGSVGKVIDWIGSRFSKSSQEDKRPSLPSSTSAPVVYQDPQWPASSTIDWELRNQLPKELIEKIDQSPVPVLLPGDVEVARRATIYSQAASSLVDVSVSGFYFNLMIQKETEMPSRSSFPDTVRNYPGWFRGGEGERFSGWVVQWVESDVLYYLELQCSRCNDYRNDAQARDIVNNLRYVGGAGWKDGK